MIKKLKKLELEKLLNFFLLPFLSAFILFLSFPKINLFILVFFSFIPIFFSLSSFERDTKKIFYISLIFGTSSYLFLLYWIAYTLIKYGNLNFAFALSALIILSVYLSLYYFIFFYVASQINAFSSPSFLKGFALALLFVATEFLRSNLLTGFPWAQLGYPLSESTLFIQIADILGIWGLSFITILINYFFFYLFKEISQYHLLPKNFFQNIFLFGLSFLLVILYGVYSINKWNKSLKSSQEKIKISLLQGNIPQELKEAKEIEISLLTYQGLILKAFRERPHLVALPETALPFYFPYDKEPSLKWIEFLERLKNLSLREESFIPKIIFGAFRVSTLSSELKVHNTLFVWDGENISDFYDKEKLVPFGEYVPLVKLFPFLTNISVVSNFLKPGTSKNLILNLNNSKLVITPLICFESAFSQILVKRVKQGGGIIFIATNDAWFDQTSAPYQHFQMAKVRAVEARKYVAQAANTGISGVIDPLGRTIQESSLELEEIITAEVFKVNKITPYVKIGYLFPYFSLIFFISLFGYSNFYKFRKHRQFGS